MGADQSAEYYEGNGEYDFLNRLSPKNTRLVDFPRFSGNPQEFTRFFRAWRARLENMFAEGRIAGSTHSDCCAVFANHLPCGEPAETKVRIHEASIEELRKFLADHGVANHAETSILSSQDRRSVLTKVEEFLNTPTPGRLAAEQYIYNSLVQVAQAACPSVFDLVDSDDPYRGSKVFDHLRHHFLQRAGSDYHNQRSQTASSPR